MDQVSQSTYRDVLHAQNGDKEKAKQLIEAMMSDPQEQKLEETSNLFPNVDIELMRKILSENNWNIDNCIDQLEEINSEMLKQEKREAIQRSNARRQEMNQKNIDQVMLNFVSIPKKVQQRVLRENNNNPEKAAKVLVQMTKEISEKEEQKLAMEREKRNEQVRVIFFEKFDTLSRREIVDVLEKEKYNCKKASALLTRISRSKIFTNLLGIFSNKINKKQIKQFLVDSRWEMKEAYRLCEEFVEKQKKEEEEEQQLLDGIGAKFELVDSVDKEEEEHQSKIFANGVENIIKRREKEESEKIIKKIVDTIVNLPLETSEEEEEEEQQQEEQQENSVEKQNNAGYLFVKLSKKEDKLVASFNFPGATRSAWLALYNEEEKNEKSYLSYQYICYFKDTKEIQFDTPKINGKYHVRLFSCSHEKIFTSNSISLYTEDSLCFTLQEEANTVSVQWNIGSHDPNTSSTYITIHKTNEERASKYRRWNYTRSFQGTYSFKKLVHAGEYEARLYKGNDCLLKSNKLTIKGI